MIETTGTRKEMLETENALKRSMPKGGGPRTDATDFEPKRQRPIGVYLFASVLPVRQN